MNRYRMTEIKLRLDESQDALADKIAKKMQIPIKSIHDLEIIRESLDARRKNAIAKVYTVDFSTKKQLNLPLANSRDYIYPAKRLSPQQKIIIVGFGPAGMFAALLLAQMGYCPIVLERGHDVQERTEDVRKFWEQGILNPESNVQFGEGGAGTFSDGKLTTGIRDHRIYKVLQEFCRFGAPQEILYKHKPHIGTDLLKDIVRRLREEIIRLGGEIHFGMKLEDFVIADQKIKKIIVQKERMLQEMPCDKLILAIGHSARDTVRLCYEKNVAMQQKSFSIGARIEHPQDLINAAQYGEANLANILGAADYKLHCKTSNGRGAYTFCMCPGGEIILASSGEGQVLSNGMSYHARNSRFANSALLVDVYKSDFGSDHVLAGIEFQEHWEHLAYRLSGGYHLLESNVAEFEKSSLAQTMPIFAKESILEALKNFDRKIPGFAAQDMMFKGPETRSSSPVRFWRDENMLSNLKNLYPIGEGAGYAGGIMSAAVDGIKAAEKIVQSAQ